MMNIPVLRWAMMQCVNDEAETWAPLAGSDTARLHGWLTLLSTYRFMGGIAAWRDIIEIEAYATKVQEGNTTICSLVSLLQDLPTLVEKLQTIENTQYYKVFRSRIHGNDYIHEENGDIVDHCTFTDIESMTDKVESTRIQLLVSLVKLLNKELPVTEELLAYQRLFDNKKYALESLGPEHYFDSAAMEVAKRFMESKRFPNWFSKALLENCRTFRTLLLQHQSCIHQSNGIVYR